MRIGIIAIIIGAFLSLAIPAKAYVDRTNTLGRQLSLSQAAALYEVEQFSQEMGSVVLKKVMDIKGTNAQEVKQRLYKGASRELPRFILDWAEPGNRAVIFTLRNAMLVCLGHQWFDATPGAEGWFLRGIERPEMPLAYSGPVMRLAEALVKMQAGGEAIITVVPHNTNDVLATVDTAMNRTNLPGLVPLIRVKASLKMPNMVMEVSMNPGKYILGTGAASAEDLPEFKQRLSNPDPKIRAEAADALRSLKGQAAPAKAELEKLLLDENPLVAASAAGALTAMDENHIAAAQTIKTLMKSKEVSHRRAAVRTLSMMDQTAKGFTPLLGEALSDPDEVVRALSLQALCTLGKSAASAWREVEKLLDVPATAADAADTLGRMGPAARECLPKLAKLLESTDEPTQWAAIRGMVQIGGPGADPVIDLLIKKLENADEKESYNIMMYFVVLGPDGKRALPDLQRLKERDSFRYMMAVWSMDPENTFPWDSDAMPKFFTVILLNHDIIRQNFKSVIQEMGDRARPAAKSLAKKSIEGTSGLFGNIPKWGYQLLIDFPDEALPILKNGLDEKDPLRQQGALMAIGNMGPSAKGLKNQVLPFLESDNESTRTLAMWCVKQIDPEKP